MEEQEELVVSQEQEVATDSAVEQSGEQVSETEPLINGNELIDATQNAIVGAAENVSEALTLTEKPQDVHNEEKVPLYMDVEFWVGMSFVLVVLMIAKPIWRTVKQGLQNSIKAVIDKIDEAVKLRDDAQNLLADYERRCNDIDERVAKISEQTQKNIVSYREREMKNLQRELDRKQQEVEARIERATQTAKDEINASLSVKAIDLAEKAIEKHLNESDKVRLIDEAIASLGKIK
jgi:F-type H+-transporting ATPase subunit b